MLPGRKRTTSSAVGEVSDPKVLKLDAKGSEALVESHVQIVVMGSLLSGKTSLIRSFKQELRYYTLNFLKTPCLADIPFQGRNKRCMIWDLDSAEELLGSRKEAYQEADIILLCFSIAGGYTLAEMTEEWLQEIRTYRPQIPIMLVGLKRDRRFETDREVQLYIIPEEEANEFGADRGYVAYMEASAQHRSGVDEIFEAAVRIAMEHGLCPKSMWRNKGFRLPNDFPVAL